MKKIVLIGDSIRMGYDKYVKMALEGVAEVYYPEANCRFAAQIVRHLSEWKEEMGCGEDVDLVHWNAGLWDNLIIADGMHHFPLEIYKIYVERVCRLIGQLFPQAKMVFAATTPISEELFQRLNYKRYNRDTEKYNEAAFEIVRRYGGTINDLYTLMKEAPESYHSDQTHYYTKEGTRLLTNQVVSCIEDVLQIKGKELDFDALFSDKKDIIGV